MMSMLERKGGTAIAPMTLTGLFSAPGGTRGARPRLDGAIWVGDPIGWTHCWALITNVRDTANATTKPPLNTDGIVCLPLVTFHRIVDSTGGHVRKQGAVRDKSSS